MTALFARSLCLFSSLYVISSPPSLLTLYIGHPEDLILSASFSIGLSAASVGRRCFYMVDVVYLPMALLDSPWHDDSLHGHHTNHFNRGGSNFQSESMMPRCMWCPWMCSLRPSSHFSFLRSNVLFSLVGFHTGN
jgi:hypothetical protein